LLAQDEDGDNLLIDLGHEVLDMKFSSNVAEAERHRSYAYDTIMSLIENPKDRQISERLPSPATPL